MCVRASTFLSNICCALQVFELVKTMLIFKTEKKVSFLNRDPQRAKKIAEELIAEEAKFDKVAEEFNNNLAFVFA